MFCVQVSEQTDNAGIVLSLESKDMEQLDVAKKLLLSSLPVQVHVTAEELDSPSLSKRQGSVPQPFCHTLAQTPPALQQHQ